MCAHAAPPTFTPWEPGAKLPPEVEKLFADNAITPMGNRHPELVGTAAAVADIARRLTIPADAGGPIHVVLVDDMRVNAGFARLANGDRVIIVNVGTLYMARNDDMLAFILAHELAHGTSSISDYLAQRHAKDWRDYMLKRVVETEVDVRAVLERLFENGFNPHAGKHVLETLLEMYGEDVGPTHTTSKSRASAQDFLLEWLRQYRNGRLKTDEPKNYEYTLTKKLRAQLFDKPAFRERQIKLASAHFEPPTPLPSSFWTTYEQAWKPVGEALAQVGTHEDLLELELGLYDSLNRKYIAAAKEPLPASPTIEDIESRLYFLNRLVKIGSLPPKPYLDATRDEIARVDAKLASAAGDEKLALEAQKSALEKKLARQSAVDNLHERLRPRHDAVMGRVRAEINEAYRPLVDKLRPPMLEALRDPARTSRVRYTLGNHFGQQNVDPEFRMAALEAVATALRDPQKYDGKELHELLLSFISDMGPDDNAHKKFQHHTPAERTPELNAKIRECIELLAARKGKLPLTFGEVGRLLENAGNVGVSPGAKGELLNRGLANIRPLTYTSQIESLRATFGAIERELGPAVAAPMKAQLPDMLAEGALAELAQLDERGRGNTIYRLLETLDKLAKEGIVVSHAQRERLAQTWADHYVNLLPAESKLAESPLRHSWLYIVEPRIAKLRPLGEAGAPTKEDLLRDLRELVKSDHVFPRLELEHVHELFGNDPATETEIFRMVVDHGNRFALGYSTSSSTRRYLDWLRNAPNIPEHLLLSAMTHEDPYVVKYLDRRWREKMTEHAALPMRERAAKVKLELAAEIQSYFSYGRYKALDLAALRNVPRDLGEAIEMHLGMENHDAVEKILAGPSKPIPEVWARAAAELIRAKKTSPELDRIFEAAWRATENHPEARRALADPLLVRKLAYDFNRQTLANWQLEDRFFAKPAARTTEKNGPRADVVAARALIEQQFPEIGLVRNEVIDRAEKHFQTNRAESHLFDDLRIDRDNWFKSSRIAALDLSHVLNSSLADNFNRWKILRYILGVDEQIPAFLAQKEQRLADLAPTARREFTQANKHLRNYLLQPFLDEKTGLASVPALNEELIKLSLGKWAHEPMVRSLFEAYYKALPDSGRKVFMGGILAAVADSPTKQASLKSVLYGMGPLGIRALQFFRSSGIGGAALNKELDEVYDQADPPARHEVIERLERAFGKRLGKIHAIRDLVGSGSINYVVHAELKDDRGRIHEVAIRIQRDAVESRINAEDTVWKAALGELSGHADTDVRQLAESLDEARLHSIEHLAPGGTELDQRKEAALVENAHRAYALDTPHELTGLRQEVVRPNKLQKLVDPKQAGEISVYDFVGGSDWRKLPALERANIARQISEAELRALFTGQFFDPDGHPGNWLYDGAKKRLVRIDYPQLRAVSEAQREAVRSVIAAAVFPLPGRHTAETFADYFHELFKLDGATIDTPALEAAIRRAVATPEYRMRKTPHERLYFLRKYLESELRRTHGASLTLRLQPLFRSALGTLLRVNNYRDTIGEADVTKLFQFFLRDELAEQKRGAEEAVARRVPFLGRLVLNCVRAFRGLPGERPAPASPWVTAAR